MSDTSHGASARPLVASRAEQIKALTHPTRLKLIDLFRSGRELSAKECAEATGESIASCSFHLRQLAKYGYLERGEPRGQERPWRLPAARNIVLDTDDQHQGPAAMRLAGEALIVDAVDRLLGWVRENPDEDGAWERASMLRSVSVWATTDEMAQFERDFDELLRRFRGRTDDAGSRPAGTRHVRMLAAMWPE